MSSKTVTSTSERAPRAADDPTGLQSATVAVLMGGRSEERDVSRESGKMILQALATPHGSDDRRGPREVVAVELLEDGRWRVRGHALPVSAALHVLSDVDLFFSGLHGGEGEGGVIQGLFTSADLPFTGSDVRASAVCLDKVFARELVRAHGMVVARGRAIDRNQWTRDPDRELEVLSSWGPPGWVVKPRCGGSSVGCSVLHHRRELRAALDAAFAVEDEALVEALIPGIELTGGVVEDPHGELRALTPIEIRPHQGRFFDYEEKYSEAGALELCPPESVDEGVCEKVKRLSLLAHHVLRCRGYSRTDFILPRDSREPLFLETNTLPGLTPRSLLPLSAKTDGIDYRTLCLWIAEEGLRRRERTER